MMRPRRSFSMRRRQALEMRNTPGRLVPMTWSQSSLFMRSSSMSRVMAALFTRMVGSPSALSRLPTSASIEPASPASSTVPRPCRPLCANIAVMRLAPASLVAVPTTRAPARARVSAMARPMPREAPVTRARSFSNMCSSGARSERGLDGGGIFERNTGKIRAALDAPIEPGQHFARPAFDKRRDAGGQPRAPGVAPAPGTRGVGRKERANILRVRVQRGIDGAEIRNLRRAQLDCRESLSKAPRGGLHETAVRGHAHRPEHGALRAPGGRGFNGALHRRTVTGDHDLVWAVEIHRFDGSAARGFAACRQHRRILKPENRRHRAAAERHGLLHGAGAKRDEFKCRGIIERSRTHEGRELTQAVAADDSGRRPARLAPESPGGNASGEHCRLRALRAIELLGGPVLGELPKIVVQRT